MINDLENKTNFDTMSDLEFGKNQVEMMRYRANGLSYKLGFFGLILSILGAFVCLNSFQSASALVIVKILMNIAVLLVGFLCCEKMKAYSKAGSLTMVGIGVVCGLRIFWIPLQLMIYYNRFVSLWTDKNSYLDSNQEVPTELQADIDNCANYLGKTITSEYDGGVAVAWFPHSGNFRAVVAIILLAAAAALLITAGVIGYLRAKKLSTYLESIKEVK